MLEPWDEASVNWSNQPIVDEFNPIVVEGTLDSIELKIDVTGHINDMLQNPASNHGWEFRLVFEDGLRKMNFCSSDHIDSTKRPLLVLFAGGTTGFISNPHLSAPLIWPNPIQSQAILNISPTVESVIIYDDQGLQVRNVELISSKASSTHLIGLAPGSYLVALISRGKTVTRRLIISN